MQCVKSVSKLYDVSIVVHHDPYKSKKNPRCLKTYSSVASFSQLLCILAGYREKFSRFRNFSWIKFSLRSFFFQTSYKKMFLFEHFQPKMINNDSLLNKNILLEVVVLKNLKK